MKNINWLLFKMSDVNVLVHVAYALRSKGYTDVRECKDFVYATGTIPVMLVAHADTVHARPPQDVFYDSTRGVIWSPDGVGADDRAGILGIMELVHRGYRPHVLITTGEETGGIGAHAFVKQVKDTGVHYVIELDRSGVDDAVFYGCTNKEFKEYVCRFGFTEAPGIFTDISILCPRWGVAGVNLSCGYYNAHTANEYLLLGELRKTVDRVEKMLQDVPKHRFKYGSAQGGADTQSDDLGAGYEEIHMWTTISPHELVYIYGGTVGVWEVWLQDNKDVLQDTADEAVWEKVDTLVQQSGVPVM